MEEKVYYNGKIMDRNKVQIDIEDRGYQFGDGVYEVIAVYKGRPFKFDEHFTRLQNSAEALEIYYNNYQELKNRAHELITAYDHEYMLLYVQISRGVCKRSHAYPEQMQPQVVMKMMTDSKRPEEKCSTGVRVITVSDERWSRCFIKSISLLPNVLAKKRAHREGAHEAIQIRDGYVTEGTSSNVFIVRKGVVTTPPATNYILNGITRRVVLEICNKREINLKEKSISVTDLYSADEVFLCGTTTEIMPVIKIDNREINKGLPGTFTERIANYYQQLIFEIE